MFTKECGIWATEAGMGCSQSDAEITLKAIGLMTKEKAKDLTSFVKKTKFLLDNGWMIHQRREYTLKLRIRLQLKFKDRSISLTLTSFQPSIK